eukprot:1747822-Amphidinium_carterae.1
MHELNVGKDGSMKRSAATAAVDDYVMCLSSFDASVWQVLVDVAEEAGQTYLGCMAALEHAALFQKPMTFAKKNPQHLKRCLAAFKKAHTKMDQLTEGIVESLMLKFKQTTKKSKQQRRRRRSQEEVDKEDEDEEDERLRMRVTTTFVRTIRTMKLRRKCKEERTSNEAN